MRLVKILVLILSILIVSCRKETTLKNENTSNSINFANGLEIFNYQNFTIIKITKPWPNATKTYTYICAKDQSFVPDSLKTETFIKTPIKNLVATSTTHVSAISALNVTDKLIGFPNLDYISSENVRKRIKKGFIKELSDNSSLNFEHTLDLAPKVIIGLSMDSETSKFNQFEKAGIPVIYNADWVETTPLGKAEWIKFFGVLFDKQDEANDYFNKVANEYKNAKKLVLNIQNKPTVLSGSIFQDVWYIPQGGSWMAQYINDAGGNYLWSDTSGTGSLSLSFETVFEKAMNADFWIGPGEFTTFDQMILSNKHYSKFKSFNSKNIFSYSIKKGETGGLIFYEDASLRPDLVLKDLISIFHPEKLPNYQTTFLEKLK